MMVQNGISSVIVMEAEEMLGLITLRELANGLYTHGGNLMQSPCGRVMKVNPPVAKPEDSIDHLRGLMTELYQALARNRGLSAICRDSGTVELRR